MKISLFHSDAECGVYAYTLDDTGTNLPGDFAPWTQVWVMHAIKSDSQRRGDQKKLGTLILQALEHEGFSLVCTRSVSERLGLESVDTVH